LKNKYAYTVKGCPPKKPGPRVYVTLGSFYLNNFGQVYQ